MKRRFIQCDVFSALPARGNGLAVIVDGEGLSGEDMQAFAAWTNLAETTFLLPPDGEEADYAVRIFTPTREMPFAGHPTLGSCMSWLHAGGEPWTAGVVRQSCGVGIVTIEISDGRPAFVAPPTTIDVLSGESLEAIRAALGIEASRVLRSALLDNGPVWQAIELASAADVLALDSSRLRFPDFRSVGFIGAHAPGGECAYEVRMLGPSSGMSEDPITGSLNAALAHWLKAQGRLDAPYVAAQGTAIKREGRVFVRPRGDDVLVGGDVTILIEGTLDL